MELKNYIFILISTFLLALSSNIVKKYNVGSIIQTFIIFICLVILSFIFYFVKKEKRQKVKKLVKESLDTKMISISAANYAKFITLLTSVSIIGPGLTCSIYQTSPCMTALLSKILYNRKITKISIFGIILTFIGIIVINALSIKELFTGKMNQNIFFLLLPLISAICQAYTLVEFKEDKNEDPDQKVFSMTFFALIIGTIVFTIYSFSDNLKYKLQNIGIPVINLNKYNIFFNTITGIMIYLAYKLIYKGLDKLKAIEVSIILSLGPIFTFIIQYLFFRKPIPLIQIIGCIIIIVGSIVVSKGTSGKINPDDSKNIHKILTTPALIPYTTKNEI